jgi:predicted TPR repeat methyltransferase
MPETATAMFLSSGDLIADRRYHYAREFEARGDLAAAVDLMVQAVELAPRFASAWFALGELRERGGDRDGATAAFAQALAADAEDRHGARLRLARLGEGAPEDAMSAGYVRALFDQYAPRFEATLRDGLAYRGPELLRAALAEVAQARGQKLHFSRIIDLGCGTGLMVEALAGTFDEATGVDLSPAMIAQARRKARYTRVVVADMLTFLQERSGAADLVIAADAFVYVANLGPLCRVAGRVLAPRGLLAFTVETHAGAGVILNEKLRYAHGADHVQAAVEDAGLTLLRLAPASTRQERGDAVPGLVAIAGHPTFSTG